MTSPFIQQIADNRVCQVLTCLPEKFVVDFANGLRNTLIQSSEDHKRDQQAQERLTGRLQALNERVPELITDSKALREELETML
nr:hypothetical protein [Escherichia coli]